MQLTRFLVGLVGLLFGVFAVTGCDDDGTSSLGDVLGSVNSKYGTLVLKIINRAVFENGLSFSRVETKTDYLEKVYFHTFQVVLSNFKIYDKNGRAYELRQEPVSVDLENAKIEPLPLLTKSDLPIGEYVALKFYLQSVRIVGENFDTTLSLNKEIFLSVDNFTMSRLEIKGGEELTANLIFDIEDKVFKDVSNRWRIYPAVILTEGGMDL